MSIKKVTQHPSQNEELIFDRSKTGRIGYLGLDVYEQEEKLFFNDLSENILEDEGIMRLLSFPNVLVTSHQGFFTEEALAEIAKTTLSNIAAFEARQTVQNRVV